jgi:hypothetical protein
MITAHGGALLNSISKFKVTCNFYKAISAFFLCYAEKKQKIAQNPLFYGSFERFQGSVLAV